jgi:hypothetical protein
MSWPVLPECSAQRSAEHVDDRGGVTGTAQAPHCELAADDAPLPAQQRAHRRKRRMLDDDVGTKRHPVPLREGAPTPLQVATRQQPLVESSHALEDRLVGKPWQLPETGIAPGTAAERPQPLVQFDSAAATAGYLHRPPNAETSGFRRVRRSFSISRAAAGNRRR